MPGQLKVACGSELAVGPEYLELFREKLNQGWF